MSPQVRLGLSQSRRVVSSQAVLDSSDDDDFDVAKSQPRNNASKTPGARVRFNNAHICLSMYVPSHVPSGSSQPLAEPPCGILAGNYWLVWRRFRRGQVAAWISNGKEKAGQFAYSDLVKPRGDCKEGCLLRKEAGFIRSQKDHPCHVGLRQRQRLWYGEVCTPRFCPCKFSLQWLLSMFWSFHLFLASCFLHVEACSCLICILKSVSGHFLSQSPITWQGGKQAVFSSLKNEKDHCLKQHSCPPIAHLYDFS